MILTNIILFTKNRINFNLHSSSLDRILFLLIVFLFPVAFDSLSELSIILSLLEADEIDIMSISLIASSFRFLDIFFKIRLASELDFKL